MSCWFFSLYLELLGEYCWKREISSFEDLPSVLLMGKLDIYLFMQLCKFCTFIFLFSFTFDFLSLLIESIEYSLPKDKHVTCSRSYNCF